MNRPTEPQPLTRGTARRKWLSQFFDTWLDRLQMHEDLFAICVAIVIGTLCGFGAVAFRYLIVGCHYVFWGHGELMLELLHAEQWWRRILMPALGGLAVGPIIYYLAREAKGHGVPEVMLAVAVRNGLIRVRVAFAKAVASALTIASGGSAGREGPIIQIGSAIGSWVGQLLKVSSRKMRTFVGCGAAAGIAATFNAPIAGALFSVEIILGEFGIAQFSPIVISSVLATVIARHYFGSGPVFEVPGYNLVSPLELLPYLVLGLLCGVVAFAFIRVLYYFEDIFERTKKIHELIQPMVGGLALGILGLAVPHVYGDGYQSINLALNNELPFLMLLVLLLAKGAATSFTLGSGGSGGVFAPSLFMGAMAGGVLGKMVGVAFDQTAGAAGGYALVAMGGLVAGTTHAPITAILIIFEITYDYAIILPLMTVCIISTVVCRALNRESIYTLKLVRRGVDIFRGRSLDLLKSHKVADYVDSEVETVRPETSVKALMEQMINSERTQFYVTTGEGRLFGVITMTDLRRILMHREGLEQVLLAEDLAHEQVPVCEPAETLSQALHKFERARLSELPVVSDASGRKLLGALHYEDVFAIYSEEVLKLDSAEGVAQRLTVSARRQKVRLMRGFSMVEWEPPSALWHKTLAEASLPTKFGVRVLLVKKVAVPGLSQEELVPTVPGRDYVITPRDSFLIYGRDEDVDAVLKL